MPDGRIIQNVPEGTTQVDLIRRLKGFDEVKPGFDFGRGLVQTIGQGISLGFSDEIAAGLASVPAAISTGNPLGEVFDEILGDIRGNQEAFADVNPKTAFAAELGGAVLTGGAGGVRLAGSKALQNAPKILKTATAAAVPGAIFGAGSTEGGAGDRAVGAAQGAAIGAAIGTSIPVVGKAVGSGVKAVATSVDNLFRGAPTKTLRKIQQAFERDSISPTQASRKLASLGENASLTDIGGANVRGLAEDAANRPGVAANQAERFLRGRNEGQRARLIDLVKSKLSTQSDNLQEAVEEISTKMRTQAAPLYESAYSTPIQNNPLLQGLLKNPKVKPLLKKAIKNAQSDVTLPNSFKSGLNAENPNIVVWDYVKRELADKGFKAGGNQGRIFKGIEKKLVKELDRQVPDYGKARSIWSGGAKQLEALEAGQNVFKDIRKDPDFAISAFNKLGADEQELFRLGAGRRLIALMKNVDDTLEGAPPSSVLKQIAGSPAKREVLKAIFPDDKEFRQFMRGLNSERVFQNNSNKLLANSRTAARQALREDSAVDVSVVGDAADALQGKVSGIGRLIKRITSIGKNDPAIDKETAKRFFTSDAKEIKETLRLMESQGSLLPTKIQNALKLKPPALLKWLKTGSNQADLIQFLSSGPATAAAAG